MIRWRVRWYWYVVAIGLPLAVVLVTVVLNVALGASVPSLAGVGSVSTVLMMFAIRLINPGDGALGEEPGWRGVALPGLQSTLSPLVSTPHPRRGRDRLACTHPVPGRRPLAAVDNRGLPPGIVRGDVLLHLAVQPHRRQRAHDGCGPRLPRDHPIGALWSASADFAQAMLLNSVVLSVLAIGLVVFDRKAWLGPAAAETTTPEAVPPRAAAPATPA